MIGAVVPLGIVIAFSPTAVVATVVGLRTKHGMRTSIAIAVGWTAAIAASLVFFALVGAYLPALGARDDEIYIAIAKMVLGVGLVGVAAWQWRHRGVPDAEFTTPKWIAAISAMRPGTAAGIGFALGAAKPKNLLLSAYAGINIGSADDLAVALVAGALYVVVASSAVAVPVIAMLVMPTHASAALDWASELLTRYWEIFASVVLLAFGVAMIGSGIVDL